MWMGATLPNTEYENERRKWEYVSDHDVCESVCVGVCMCIKTTNDSSSA